MENNQTIMETTTLLVWTRALFNEEDGLETDAEVASIEVYRNTDGKLAQFAVPVDNDLNVEGFGLEVGIWTEKMERYLIELNIRPEEFELDLLDLASPFYSAIYSDTEVEVEDGNGTAWGSSFSVDEDGMITSMEG